MAAVFTSGALASELKQNTTPAAILTDLNRAVFHHSRRGHFVAFLSGCLSPRDRIFTFANGGQTKPLLRRGTTVQWLDGTGPHFALGMQAGTVYENCHLELRQGDILFLLTDGFTEAMNEARESFGPERVEQAAAEDDIAALSAAEILTRITSRAQAFAGTAAQHDDMTLVVIKVL
jgi:serine phosphatase RsbU (regulator of sigma subunit)